MRTPAEILASTGTIALVGASPSPERPAHGVMRYDVFRSVEACPGHAREAVEAGAKAVWLQLGLVSPESRRIATEAGLDYVENACTAVVHRLEVA
jgi:predicted CoA-binding protein